MINVRMRTVDGLPTELSPPWLPGTRVPGPLWNAHVEQYWSW